MDRIERRYYATIIVIALVTFAISEAIEFVSDNFNPGIPRILSDVVILIAIVLGAWRIWIVAKRWAGYRAGTGVSAPDGASDLVGPIPSRVILD